MIIKHLARATACRGAELFQFRVGFRCPERFTHVDAAQRTDAVHAVGIAAGDVMRELQIRPWLGRFMNNVVVAGRVMAIDDDRSVLIHNTNETFVVFPLAARSNKAHVHAIEFAKNAARFAVEC